MFRLGPWEIAIIALAIILIFGPKRLPELGHGIGEFIKNFKNSLSKKDDNNDPKTPGPKNS